MNKYDELTKLGDLRDRGILSEEEFLQEKAKILGQGETKFQDSLKDFFQKPKEGELLGGLSENTYCVLLHLSQFLIPFLNVFGFAVPLFLWFFGKDKSDMVDRCGRNVLNWLLCLTVYLLVCVSLSYFMFVGFTALVVLLIICAIAFPIIAAIKANEGIVWDYPLKFDILTFIQELGHVDKSKRTSSSYGSAAQQQSKTDPGPPVKTHFSQSKYSSEHSTDKYK